MCIFYASEINLKFQSCQGGERGARSGSQVEETEFQTVPGYNFPCNLIYRYLTRNQNIVGGKFPQEIEPVSDLSQTHKLQA